MDNETRDLIQILATTDAVFWPVRNWNEDDNILIARIAYAAEGVVVTPMTNSRSAQKRRLRRLDELIEREMVVRFRQASRRTTGYKLTDTGDWFPRNFIGYYAQPSSMGEFLTLYKFRNDKRTVFWVGRRWIPETLPARAEWGDRGAENEFKMTQDLLLPALVRGWIVSNSSIQGHVWYSLTDSGKRVAKSSEFPQEFPDNANMDAWRFYEQCFVDARHRLASTKRARAGKELGEIPLPVSMA